MQSSFEPHCDEHEFDELARLNEHFEHVRQAREFLEQVAMLAREPRFMAWLERVVPSRFEWACKAVQDRLSDPFRQALSQWAQGRLSETDAIYLVPDTRKALDLLADECQAVAEELEAITFPTLELGSDAGMTGFLYGLLKYRPDVASYHTGKETRQIDSLIEYLMALVQARMTLEQDTGHAGFEGILYGITEKYLLNGLPLELLSADAELVRERSKGLAIAMHKNHCVTAWLFNDADVQIFRDKPEFVVYPL